MPHSLTCTFCRKTEHEVRKLVAGPGVYICDACIELAHDIINDVPPKPPLWRRTMARCGRALTSFASGWQRLDVTFGS